MVGQVVHPGRLVIDRQRAGTRPVVRGDRTARDEGERHGCRIPARHESDARVQIAHERREGIRVIRHGVVRRIRELSAQFLDQLATHRERKPRESFGVGAVRDAARNLAENVRVAGDLVVVAEWFDGVASHGVLLPGGVRIRPNGRPGNVGTPRHNRDMKDFSEPGGGMGSDADVAALAEIIAGVETVEGQLTAAQVAQVRLLARAGRLAESQAAGTSANVRVHDMALRSIAAEVGGVLRVTDRTVQARIGEAREIVESYPAALAAWESGSITRGHVRVIVDAGVVVPLSRKADYEQEAIERCRIDTPNRVRAGLEILAERMGEQSFTERHVEACATRAVRVFPGRNGMSDVVATVPTVIADGIFDRLTQQAQSVVDVREPGDDDRRGIDQVRADVFADLLLAGAPALDPTATGDGPGALGAIRAQVQVIVPALTLLGTDDGPADLVGRSPIDADTARCLAENAPSWTRVLTDPIDGTVVAVDRYRTPWPQRRYLQARDQHCRFPGCRRAAIRCEVDHTIDAAKGGPTALWNLAHLCQRHHSMKQFTRWKVRQLPGGILEWTSPTGRIYREDAPAPPVSFAPAYCGDAPF